MFYQEKFRNRLKLQHDKIDGFFAFRAVNLTD